MQAAQPKIVDFRDDVLIGRGVNRGPQFFDQEFEKLATGPLQGFAKGVRADGRPLLFAEHRREFFDRSFGMIHPQEPELGNQPSEAAKIRIR